MKHILMNPILRKELKLGSRTLKFPFALMAYALVMTFISAIILAITVETSYANSTIEYQILTIGFMVIVFVQFALICIIVPILTAGTIAGEREKQTLDIMLTAPITPLSIVMGKLSSVLVKVLMFIFCSLPALSLCFIYGGIKWYYLLIFVGEILAIAFFIGSIGVWCSSVFRKTIVSVIMTLIFEVIFYAGPFVILMFGCLIDAVVEAALAGGFEYVDALHVGILPLILLLDPAFGFVDAIVKSNTGYSVAEMFLGEHFLTPMKGLSYLSNAWPWISMIVTIGIGVFFIWMAARRIDAIRRKGLKMKK